MFVRIVWKSDRSGGSRWYSSGGTICASSNEKTEWIFEDRKVLMKGFCSGERRKLKTVR